MKHEIYFVIGASGSGKTAALTCFNKTPLPSCLLLHFDDIGVPSFADMERDYKSIEEWQRVKTREWVEKIKKEHLGHSHVIFDAQVRPSFIKEACEFYGVSYRIILFDCFDEERERRLILRGHQELVGEHTKNWALYLRKECQKEHHKIINNTHLTIDQTFQLFYQWLKEVISPKFPITVDIVLELIKTQFPEYAHLPLKKVEPQGWDNYTYLLGRDLSVRLPSAERYAEKVLIEQHWLPRLASHLSFSISKPIALGKPSDDYPWNWSIYEWIEGQSADLSPKREISLERIAEELAQFLQEWEAIDSSEGPKPGTHNFFRGNSPLVYQAETRSLIDALTDYFDAKAITLLWQKATSSRWSKKPVWVHGDFSAGNIILKGNHLKGMIDFGGMAVGDPSCDLVIAWTFLKGKSREKFKSLMKFDQDTWDRAKGWALWKALITFDTFRDKTSVEANMQLNIINDILQD